MRKLLTFIAAMSITGSIIAGGLVTNNNQSIMYTRLQNRNASTGIDAVFFNPAGVTKLGEGFFVSLNNQTISQTQKVGNDYPYLNAGGPRNYYGKVSAPIYPGVYVAYNTGKLSFSAGFNPIGGGGGATYKSGLPSFEIPVSNIAPTLYSQGINTTSYSADIYFKGSSVYFGYQFNVGYKVNDQVSVAAGVRLVQAKNTYSGYLKNISINPVYPPFGTNYDGRMVLASDFFTSGANFLNGLATSSSSAASGLAAAIGSGIPAGTPLAAMPAATVAGVTQLLGAAGISAAGMNIGTAAATLNAVAPAFTAKAVSMAAHAAAAQDVNVDASESGTGYTPILSANYSPTDKLNIAVKYEFKTKLSLTQKVNNNMGGGRFFDGTKVIADLPAILFVGADFKATDKLMITGSFNYYFDKKVDYDGSADTTINMIDKNFLEFGLGAEYSLSDKLRISAGWSKTITGVNSNYQSDMRYSTNTNTLGAGFGYRITPMIDLNIGGQYTFYAEDKKSWSYPMVPSPIWVTEIYNKKTWIVGVGLDFTFGKTKSETKKN